MFRALVFAATTTVILPLCSHAGDPAISISLNGEELREYCCASEKPIERGFCRGYLIAMSNAYLGELTNQTFCLPETVSVGQLRTAVVSWIGEDPEKVKMHASELVISALSAAFPCR